MGFNGAGRVLGAAALLVCLAGTDAFAPAFSGVEGIISGQLAARPSACRGPQPRTLHGAGPRMQVGKPILLCVHNHMRPGAMAPGRSHWCQSGPSLPPSSRLCTGRCWCQSGPSFPPPPVCGLALTLSLHPSLFLFLSISQVPQWVQVAATQQQRDPARLVPLKPLSEVLVVRMPEKKEFAEGEFAPGLLGLGQKINPGDWSEDMMKVKQLARDIGRYSEQQIFEMNFLGQGCRSYMVCEDSRTGEIVACAQLTRIQVGGYLYLTDDYQIQHVFVKEEYRRYGIANHMIHELLTRLKPTQRAWAFADKDSEAFFALFASGFVGITYKECGRVFPGALWVALWPFHRVGMSNPNNIFFAAEGRGTMAAYNPAG